MRRIWTIAIPLLALTAVACGPAGEKTDTQAIQASSSQTVAADTRPSTTTTTAAPTTTTTQAPTTTVPPTTAAPTTTAPPPPPPVYVPPAAPAAPSGCDPNYTGCVPIASDVDCLGGSGNGPAYTGPVRVIGVDIYGLDSDNDGYACE